MFLRFLQLEAANPAASIRNGNGKMAIQDGFVENRTSFWKIYSAEGELNAQRML